MAENDVQLELKKRARRRLVGAIALALVAAIVLPMVMDSEPRSSSGELSIRIPSQEGGNYASQLIKGNAPPPDSPTMPAASAPAASIAPADEPDAAPESAVEPPKASGAASVSSSAAQPQPPKPAASSTASSRHSSSHSSERHDDARRARDILEGKTVQEAAAPAPGHVYVQLGVYKDEANARETASRAAAAGVKVNLEKAGDKTRVRTGAIVDRAAADKIVEKLRKAGLNGFVTTK